VRTLKKWWNSWRQLFGDPIRAFGITSVLLLIALAIAPAKDHFSEWRHYQRGYIKLIQSRRDAPVLERHFQAGIHQIWLPDLGVVDRCETCHLGLTEASLGDVRMEPYSRHPAIPHSMQQFGCAICHRGQGAATTVAAAHDSTLAPNEPILPARYDEAACGQCHHAHLEGTPTLNEGREMLARYGCVRCHTIKLPDGSAMQPTDAPPPLTHIADKTTREWIYAWLKDPTSYAASATMPNFVLSDQEASDISAFLIANSVPKPGDTATVKAASATTADPTAGASLYGESFCASCHAMQNAAGNLVGGDLGPELTAVGTKVKPEWLTAWLRDPRNYDAGTAMPHYRFTDAQLALLSGFLESKTNSDLLANVHLDPATPEQIAHGKQLVEVYGCAACHAIRGVPKPDNYGPDLSRIGSKPLAQLVFTADMPRTLPAYLSNKIAHPRIFGPGLHMPQFTFTPDQIDALTTALLSLTDRSYTLPAKMQISAARQSGYEPAGKAGELMTDLNCMACHRINGHGGDMAPDLSWEGSAVQRQWLDAFLKNPNTLRPALIRRMPKFNLTDQERTELTNYIMTVYQNPKIDRDAMPAGGYSPEMVERGRQLFYGKYACQSCHIVDPVQDRGYIGPTLTEVGSRLNAEWIYLWLKNPQLLRPGTIEPNRGMSDDDARALTAFLMMQKGTGSRKSGTKVANLRTSGTKGAGQ
jgi:mono/diheme cytochrome c family protein